jgi:hypothetical protein
MTHSHGKPGCTKPFPSLFPLASTHQRLSVGPFTHLRFLFSVYFLVVPLLPSPLSKFFIPCWLQCGKRFPSYPQVTLFFIIGHVHRPKIQCDEVPSAVSPSYSEFITRGFGAHNGDFHCEFIFCEICVCGCFGIQFLLGMGEHTFMWNTFSDLFLA